ncbi:GspH/FimT family pseudopilin [Pseudomonas chengduensis]|nr:GspH/FimT family pseudopilin [Pseudomonas chengduensis]MDH1283537.1 GspH/FimT family pseudopilin [Pseudomonas chengduensis]MDH1537953.1 GspH/FimT family pseudopilin [Pseudomonas chengduensis]|tara:strand:+ start:650 stop:1153 length:504 start_codon:yes stop_codon:yes gene_type:complete
MPSSRSTGFTLLEHLIALTILAILTTIAAPVLTKMLQNAQDQAAMEKLNTLLHLARSQAVEHRKTLRLCPSKDGIDCTTDWSEPWLLSTEQNQKLYHSRPYSGASPLRWTGFSDALRFHGNGTSPTSNGRFYICNEQIITQQLVINRQGRIRRSAPRENQEQSYRCL